MLAERYGWKPWDIVRLTPGELQQYLDGAETREERKQRTAKRGSPPSPDQRRREQEALEKFA